MKHLFFSLLLTSTAVHSMELAVLPDTILHNPTILCNVTHKICVSNDRNIKKNIRALSTTDKKLYEHYKKETTQQNIVRHVALHRDISDSMMALYLGYPIIKYKIDRLFAKRDLTKRNLGFTQEDLRDRWYLDSTRPCAYLDGDEKETLIAHPTKRNL